MKFFVFFFALLAAASALEWFTWKADGTANCGEGEVFRRSFCEDNCKSSKPFCSDEAGCACQRGYSRGLDGRCVKEC